MLKRPARAAGPDRFRGELAAFGLGEAQIAAMLAHAAGADQKDEIEVYAWLATSLRWFLAMASQWRRDGEGRAVGLDYGPAEATARLAGLEIVPDDFAHLQILEQATLSELRDRAARRPGRGPGCGQGGWQ